MTPPAPAGGLESLLGALQSTPGSVLDQDGDGSAIDDVLDMAKKLF